MGLLGGEKVIESLIKTLNDDLAGVRWVAAKVLGEIGDARAIAPLVERLKDRDWETREAAARSLGKIGDKRTLEALRKALEQEPVKFVRRGLREATERLDGKD